MNGEEIFFGAASNAFFLLNQMLFEIVEK